MIHMRETAQVIAEWAFFCRQRQVSRVRAQVAVVWMCLLLGVVVVAFVISLSQYHKLLMHEGQEPRNSRARSLSGDFEVTIQSFL